MPEKLQHKKSYTIVIDYIKKQIRAGVLKMGGKLPTERELSEMLGVSRNSVREAIRTLDIMGVIECQQGAGNYLTGNFEYNLEESLSMMFLLNQIDYNEISQLRRGLELQALTLAIDNITGQEVAELQDIISKLEYTSEENNVILDKRLHYNIALASKNTLIMDILNALSEVMDQFIADLRREILGSEDSKDILREAHINMVKSLVLKDKKLAYEAINSHFDMVDMKLKSNERNVSLKQ